jgi:hypothetical protein
MISKTSSLCRNMRNHVLRDPLLQHCGKSLFSRFSVFARVIGAIDSSSSDITRFSNARLEKRSWKQLPIRSKLSVIGQGELGFFIVIPQFFKLGSKRSSEIQEM